MSRSISDSSLRQESDENRGDIVLISPMRDTTLDRTVRASKIEATFIIRATKVLGAIRQLLLG